MREFYRENRLYLMWGNHDIERKVPEKVKETLYEYVDERTGKVEPLFEGIEVHEGLVLRHSDTGSKIFLVHGHQGGLIEDNWWWLGRFFVRHFWRHLQLLGIRDPTRPAENFKKQGEVEQGILEWVGANNQMTICGHTHRSRFPRKGDLLYFNTGSCVHPRCITGIEIQNGEIALIKWWYRPRDDGVMCITKEVIVGPKKLESFF
jgi:predicted phosphodiesterase